MSLEPVLHAAPVIRVHAFAAMGAFVLGSLLLLAPNGTLPHRILGWTWVTLMAVVGVSVFFIHEVRLWGPWSPIYLLAAYTVEPVSFDYRVGPQ